MYSVSPCQHHCIPCLYARLSLLFLLLAMPIASSAETPSSIMSKAMIAMMDTMGDLALQFKSRGNWSLGSGYSPYGLSTRYNDPWNLYSRSGPHYPGGAPLQSPPGYGARPWAETAPLYSPAYPPFPERSAVDGIWLGQGGELVLVMYGHFRIYASAEIYRDGLFEIRGDKLVMYDPQSDQRMAFDYRFEEGRMLLRSPSGALMLFKQLPIPIPPQGLFFDPSLP